MLENKIDRIVHSERWVGTEAELKKLSDSEERQRLNNRGGKPTPVPTPSP